MSALDVHADDLVLIKNAPSRCTCSARARLVREVCKSRLCEPDVQPLLQDVIHKDNHGVGGSAEGLHLACIECAMWVVSNSSPYNFGQRNATFSFRMPLLLPVIPSTAEE